MSLVQLETSRQSGAIVELWRFFTSALAGGLPRSGGCPVPVYEFDVVPAAKNDGDFVASTQNGSSTAVVGSWTAHDVGYHVLGNWQYAINNTGTSGGGSGAALNGTGYIRMLSTGISFLPGGTSLVLHQKVAGFTPGKTYTVTYPFRFLNYADAVTTGVTSVSATADASGVLTLTVTYTPGYTGGILIREALWFGRLLVFDPADGTPCSDNLDGDAPVESALHYTTADVDIVYAGDTYVPMVGVRTPFTAGSGEARRGEVDLRVPLDHALAQLAMDASPRSPIHCTVYRVHRADLTDAAIPLQAQVVRAKIDGPWCVVTLGSLQSLMARKKPSMLTQRHCPHVLYGAVCRADEASKTFTGLTVTAVSGRLVTVSGASAASGTDTTFFAEGLLRLDDGKQAFIETQAGNDLTLTAPLGGLGIGDTVTLVAGCDRLVVTCDTRHNNAIHFGGEPAMPTRSPFDGAGIVGGGSA